MDPDADTHGRTIPFFVLTFAFTGMLQAPAVLARLRGVEGSVEAWMPLAMFGILGPTVGALTMAHREAGRAGIRQLLEPLLRVRVSPRWYIAALVLPGALLTGGLLLLRAAGREGPIAHVPGPSRLIVGCAVALAEEIGWRGYAQPRLERRYGVFGGAGIVGVGWTLWHVPMFLGAGVPLELLLVMCLFFVGGSLFFGWIRRGAGGSLLLVVLAHLGAHLDNSHSALPSDSLPAVVHAIVYGGLGLMVAWPSLAQERRRARRNVRLHTVRLVHTGRAPRGQGDRPEGR